MRSSLSHGLHAVVAAPRTPSCASRACRLLPRSLDAQAHSRARGRGIRRQRGTSSAAARRSPQAPGLGHRSDGRGLSATFCARRFPCAIRGASASAHSAYFGLPNSGGGWSTQAQLLAGMLDFPIGAGCSRNDFEDSQSCGFLVIMRVGSRFLVMRALRGSGSAASQYARQLGSNAPRHAWDAPKKVIHVP